MNYDIIYNIVEKGEEGRKFSSITLYNGGENIECTGPWSRKDVLGIFKGKSHWYKTKHLIKWN